MIEPLFVDKIYAKMSIISGSSFIKHPFLTSSTAVSTKLGVAMITLYQKADRHIVMIPDSKALFFRYCFFPIISLCLIIPLKLVLIPSVLFFYLLIFTLSTFLVYYLVQYFPIYMVNKLENTLTSIHHKLSECGLNEFKRTINSIISSKTNWAYNLQPYFKKQLYEDSLKNETIRNQHRFLQSWILLPRNFLIYPASILSFMGILTLLSFFRIYFSYFSFIYSVSKLWNFTFILLSAYSFMFTSRLIEINNIANTNSNLTSDLSNFYDLTQILKLPLNLISLNEDLEDNLLSLKTPLSQNTNEFKDRNLYLQIKSLNFQINNKKNLNDVDLSLEKGYYYLIGKNGQGKTTLANILTGYYELEDFKGEIKLITKDKKSTSNIILEDRESFRSNVLCLDQKPGLIVGSVLQNILLGLRPVPKVLSIINELKQDLALKIDLSSKLDPATTGFSGGELKKLEIIRGIIHHRFNCPKKLIILDEIRANMDPRTSRLVSNLFKTYFKDAIVLELTHDISYIKDQDPVVLLSEGVLKQALFSQIKKTSSYSDYIGIEQS